MTFQTSVAGQGAAPCWVTISADGEFLYVSNTGTDSIGVYSWPTHCGPFNFRSTLSGPFAPPGVADRQTASFQVALDPSGGSLYVVTQDTAAGRDFQEGDPSTWRWRRTAG